MNRGITKYTQHKAFFFFRHQVVLRLCWTNTCIGTFPVRCFTPGVSVLSQRNYAANLPHVTFYFGRISYNIIQQNKWPLLSRCMQSFDIWASRKTKTKQNKKNLCSALGCETRSFWYIVEQQKLKWRATWS